MTVDYFASTEKVCRGEGGVEEDDDRRREKRAAFWLRLGGIDEEEVVEPGGRSVGKVPRDRNS